MVDSFNTRFSLSLFNKQVEKLSKEQRNLVKEMGFGHLLVMGYQTISRNLLAELMDRWSCKKQAFELPPGDITIMREDVALILGLRVVGEPVVLRDDEDLSELELEYGATSQKRSIFMALVEKRLNSIGAAANENFVRNFLLYTFGTLLFPNSTGTINSRYIYLLTDLDMVPRYAWGEAVMDYLFEWMGQRKADSSLQYICGCLIFLQIWSYEHIDIARPTNVSHSAFPRVCRWINRSSRPRSWFTDQFANLKKHQVIWKLNLSPAELNLDIIKDLSGIEENKLERSLTPDSNTSAARENGDYIITGTCLLEYHNVFERLVSQEIESPNVNSLEPQSSSKRTSANIIGDENNIIARRFAEEMNVLRKDLDDLKRENKILKMEDVSLLRKEMNDLKRENKDLLQGANTLRNDITRLQRKIENLKMQDEDNLVARNLLKEKIGVLTNELNNIRRVLEERSVSEDSLLSRLDNIYLED